MSIVATITSTLSGLVPAPGADPPHRCYADAMPESSKAPAVPAIVFQRVGGGSIVLLEQEMPDLRNPRIQITSWATTRLLAEQLADRVEEAMRLSPDLQATPLGEPIDRYDSDTKLRGSTQDFSVWLPR